MPKKFFDIISKQTDELIETVDDNTLSLYRASPELLSRIKGVMALCEGDIFVDPNLCPQEYKIVRKLEAELASLAMLVKKLDANGMLFPPEELAAMVALADLIEVQPVREEDGYCEPCEAGLETMWSVYVHYDPALSENRGVCCIADFDTEPEAREYAATFNLPVKG